MTKIITVIFLVFFLSSGMAGAEEISLTMTWDECVRETVAHQPDLVSAQQTIQESSADKIKTISTVLPNVTADAARGETKGATAKKAASSYSYGVTAKQLLFDGFKSVYDIQSASASVRAAAYKYALVSSNVRLTLRTAFVGLLYAQQFVSLTESIAERRKQNRDLVKLQYDAGREHKGALLTAEADYANAQYEVKQAKRNLSLAQTKLEKAMGWQTLRPMRVTGTWGRHAVVDVTPDFEQIADTTPFLKELIEQKEAARLNATAAKLDFLPTVYLTGSTSDSSAHWAPEENAWSAGVSISLPVFDGGNRVATALKTRATFAKAAADEQSGRDSVLVTLESTWIAFSNAADEVAVRQQYVRAAEERAKIANAQYATGLTSFDDWVIIEDNLVSARKTFLATEATLLTNEANWIQAQGGTLEYDTA